MIYYSDEARASAREGISNALNKLGELKPTESFTLMEIAQAMHYLAYFDSALNYEQIEVDKKRWKRERKKQNEHL